MDTWTGRTRFNELIEMESLTSDQRDELKELMSEHPGRKALTWGRYNYLAENAERKIENFPQFAYSIRNEYETLKKLVFLGILNDTAPTPWTEPPTWSVKDKIAEKEKKAEEKERAARSAVEKAKEEQILCSVEFGKDQGFEYYYVTVNGEGISFQKIQKFGRSDTTIFIRFSEIDQERGIAETKRGSNFFDLRKRGMNFVWSRGSVHGMKVTILPESEQLLNKLWLKITGGQVPRGGGKKSRRKSTKRRKYTKRRKSTKRKYTKRRKSKTRRRRR
jgi:hypothetical protein